MIKDKSQVPWDPDFYFVPGFTRYGIDRLGNLKNLSTNRFITWSVFKGGGKKNITGGYRVTNIHSDDGRRRGVSRHRLLALVFIHSEIDTSSLTVNHKNGIPGDDRIDNLEWSTRSENNQHAYDSGLRPNGTRRVLLRYWKTGETIGFNSISDCSKHLEMPHATLSNRLKRWNGYAYDDGLQLKFDDESAWVDPCDALRHIVEQYDVIVIEVKTGRMFVFSTVTDAAAHFGLNSEVAGLRVRNNNEKPLHGYVFKKRGGEAFLVDYRRVGYGPADK